MVIIFLLSRFFTISMEKFAQKLPQHIIVWLYFITFLENCQAFLYKTVTIRLHFSRLKTRWFQWFWKKRTLLRNICPVDAFCLRIIYHPTWDDVGIVWSKKGMEKSMPFCGLFLILWHPRCRKIRLKWRNRIETCFDSTRIRSTAYSIFVYGEWWDSRIMRCFSSRCSRWGNPLPSQA